MQAAGGEDNRPELLEKTSLDVQALISYCSRKEATTDLMRDIDSKVVKALEDDEMVVELMTVGEKFELEYRAGRDRKSVEDVDAIISELNISLERACEIIGLSVEEYNIIKENSNYNSL